MRLSGPSEPYYPLLDLLTRLARSTEDEMVAATLSRHAPSWLPHLPALSEDPARPFPLARTWPLLRACSVRW
jgi:hypothetical protein